MSEIKRLTFMQYKAKLESSNLSVIGFFMRNLEIDGAVRAIIKCDITPETIEKYVTRKYDGVTVKSGHFRWHRTGEEDCHRYYHGKNTFASVTINGVEYLLHYNKGDGEGVYINY